MLTKMQKHTLRAQHHANNYEVFLLSIDKMDEFIEALDKLNPQKHVKIVWEETKDYIETGAIYSDSIKGLVKLNAILADFGYKGVGAYIKVYKGEPYIILKGRSGLRKIFTASRYSLENAKIVKYGLGKIGTGELAEGGIYTIIFLAVYRIADYFLTDKATLSELFGRLSTDILKAGITTAAAVALTGVGAAEAAAAVTGAVGAATVSAAIVAIGPLVAVIVVGAFVAYELEKYDENHHITEHVVAALDELSEKAKSYAIAEKNKLERSATHFAHEAAHAARVFGRAELHAIQAVGRAELHAAKVIGRTVNNTIKSVHKSYNEAKSVIDHTVNEGERIMIHFTRKLTHSLMPS